MTRKVRKVSYRGEACEECGTRDEVSVELYEPTSLERVKIDTPKTVHQKCRLCRKAMVRFERAKLPGEDR